MKFAFLCMTALAIATSMAAAQDGTAAKEALVAYFEGPDEPMVERAAWSSGKVFSVGVHYMGSDEDSFARYVCGIMRKHGFAEGFRAWVVDINSMGDEPETWEVVGEARCQ